MYRRVTGVFVSTKQWYYYCDLKWCFMCDIMFLVFQYLQWYFPFYHFLAYDILEHACSYFHQNSDVGNYWSIGDAFGQKNKVTTFFSCHHIWYSLSFKNLSDQIQYKMSNICIWGEHIAEKWFLGRYDFFKYLDRVILTERSSLIVRLVTKFFMESSTLIAMLATKVMK